MNENDQELFQRISQKLMECKDGVSDDELTKLLKISQETKVDILNKMLQNGNIRVQNGKMGLVYHYQNPDDVKKMQGLLEEDLLVYQIIADKKSQGAWSGELKSKSQMNPQQLNKILKNLEKKLLVKSIKPVNSKNRKIWLLWDIQPSEEFTGGIWYRDNEIDNELIQALYSKTVQYISSQKVANKQEIFIALRSANLSEVDLREEHIQNILNLLVYDDKIEELKNQFAKSNPMYKISKWNDIIKEINLINTPCGSCPISQECKPGGVISPQNCVYFLEW